MASVLSTVCGHRFSRNAERRKWTAVAGGVFSGRMMTMAEYTVSQDRNGYWYAHRVGYAYIPLFGSWSLDKRVAQEYAAGAMGLTLKQYYGRRRKK